MYERHTIRRNPSTRYKDLVDLALFALKTPMSGEETHGILHDEVARRRKRGMVLELPGRFAAPDPHSWTGGYRKAAQGVLELPNELRTLKGVHVLADVFITPLLRDEPPAGRWHPEERTWR
ncbi:hypothetical protein [Amycolatopsis sp. NPDC051071]|uniref:hypothetical protein n=1 Tax=Amycolatopsis sp. NPDC051071 TaxID=3154637 RepID=UPI0034345D17